MEPWRTGITTSDEKSIFIRGYDVTSLMQQATFTETIFLLHQGRLPTKEERALFDAIFNGISAPRTGSAVRGGREDRRFRKPPLAGSRCGGGCPGYG